MNKIIVTLLCIFLCKSAFCEFGDELADYGFGTADIVRDDFRDRVYCTVPSQNKVCVIDSKTLEIKAWIYTGSNPSGLAVSDDGTRLYVANSGSSVEGIAIIDLKTLQLTGYISTQSNPQDVQVGLNHTVYTRESQIRAYDGMTGTALGGTISGVSVYSGMLAITPDRKTLFYHNFGLSPSSTYKIDVSTWPGVMVKKISTGSNGQDMDISADGMFFAVACGAPYNIQKRDVATMASYGQFNTGAYPRAVQFSTYGDLVFAVHTGGHIDVWDANTYTQYQNITMPGDVRDLETDRRDRVLFAGSGGNLKAFDVALSSYPVIQHDGVMNNDECIEATGPDGAQITLWAEYPDNFALSYSWSCSDGTVGTNSEFIVKVGVGQSVDITLDVMEIESGDISSSDITLCVSDTTAPTITILSPQEGDSFVGSTISIEVEINDLVDTDIDSYDLFIGKTQTMPYDGSPGGNRVRLQQAAKGGGDEMDLRVVAHDSSGNAATSTVSIVSLHDQR